MLSQRIQLILYFLYIFLALPSTANAIDRIVPTNYSTIQSAVNGANNGDTIILKDGIYKGAGNYNILLNNSKHLTIRSENGAENCIIDCEYKDRCFILESDHIIDGLTITKGYALPVEDPASRDFTGGGAILIKSNPSTIKNCKFINNSTGVSSKGNLADGGAIDIINGATPTIIKNLIMGNSSSHDGGGINVRGASPKIKGNIIKNNLAYACAGGGGISYRFNSSGVLENNFIDSNIAWFYDIGGNGGGIGCTNSNPLITNNTLTNNTSVKGDNLGSGGGLKIGGLPYPICVNNIFYNNRGPVEKENLAFYPVNLQNNLLDLSFSLLGGGLPPGVNVTQPSTILDANPKLASDGYHLLPGSPCIDRGINLTDVTYDIDGDVRPRGYRTDIGCDESQYSWSAVKREWMMYR